MLENKNRLLKTYEGATGGKTGYTGKAGRCLVFSAERDGLGLIGAVLNCPTWFDTAKLMLDWGFENFRAENTLESGARVATLAMPFYILKKYQLYEQILFFLHHFLMLLEEYLMNI